MSLTPGDHLPTSAASDIGACFPASEGWEVRVWNEREPWLLDVCMPERGGGATMNLKRRCWAPGAGNQGMAQLRHWFGVANQPDVVEYKGRGWFLRMCQDVRMGVARLLIDRSRPWSPQQAPRNIPVPDWAYTACSADWLCDWRLLWGHESNPTMTLVLTTFDAGVPPLEVAVSSISEAFWGAMLSEYGITSEATLSAMINGKQVILLVADKDNEKHVWGMHYQDPCQPCGWSYDYMGKSGDRMFRPDHWPKNGENGYGY